MRILAVAALAIVLLVNGHPATATTTAPVTIYGGWAGELPCLITAATANPSDPTTMPLTCESGTTWDGAWTGHTRYVIATTADFSTGDSSGTIDETFIGVDTATKTPGTLHLVGTVTADGSTNTLVVREHITGGTGAFDQVTGDAIFEGTQLSGLIGHGGYHATIARRTSKSR